MNKECCGTDNISLAFQDNFSEIFLIFFIQFPFKMNSPLHSSTTSVFSSYVCRMYIFKFSDFKLQTLEIKLFWKCHNVFELLVFFWFFLQIPYFLRQMLLSDKIPQWNIKILQTKIKSAGGFLPNTKSNTIFHPFLTALETSYSQDHFFKFNMKPG